jgi:hypothetical protein
MPENIMNPIHQLHAPYIESPNQDEFPIDTNQIQEHKNDEPGTLTEDDTPIATEPEMDHSVTGTSRYGITYKATAKYEQFLKELRANAASLNNPSLYSEVNTTSILENPLKYVLKAVSNADTMYFHEAMKALDSGKFKESMVSEVNQHIKKGHWI